ncbi:MAG TPA: hypothetical protein VFV47_06975, partial [Hyphomicrobiaceae bacterium]|nr:hypothetical protein [Hyphomicrobiaceae bacterium]
MTDMSEGGMISRFFSRFSGQSDVAGDQSKQNTSAADGLPAIPAQAIQGAEAAQGRGGDPGAARIVVAQAVAQGVTAPRSDAEALQLAQAQPGAQRAPKRYVFDPLRKAFVLPADTSLDDPIIAGRNIILRQPDGSQVILQDVISKDGEVYTTLPIIIGGTEIPASTLAAALGVTQLQVAADGGDQAGANGSGGNNAATEGGIGEAFPYSPLLPPTELRFTSPEPRQILPPAPEEETPVEIISILPVAGVENGFVEDPDLDVGGTTSGQSGEVDNFDITIQAGSSNVTNVVFNTNNGLTGPLTGTPDAIAGSISGQSATANFTYSLSADGKTLTILADGVPVVELKILFDPATDQIAPGSVAEVPLQITLLGAFPHEYASSVNAIIGGISILAEDASGFNDIGSFQFGVIDDVPDAIDDTPRTIAEDLVGAIDGNVLTNDVKGADGAVVTSFTVDGVTTPVPLAGVATYSNANGTYTMTSAGVWTFDPKPNLTNPANASFSYTITDSDGDQDTAVQPITITDGAGPTGGDSVSLLVDDQGLPDGSAQNAALLTDSGAVTFTAGSDALTSFVF